MRIRLDHYLVTNGLAPTRAQARDAIKRGCVAIDGVSVTKAGVLVPEAADVFVSENAMPYVSRGGLKLEAALNEFGYACRGARILDVGASTGGFTDVCLQRGALKVFAIDVGRGQLHEQLRSDSRVVALEACDVRTLSHATIPHPVDGIVMDVSFMSATLALPPAIARAAPKAWLVTLIKPQFEVGPELIGKRGIVRDSAAHEMAIQKVKAYIENETDWSVTGVIASPIAGGGGNLEFLIGASRGH